MNMHAARAAFGFDSLKTILGIPVLAIRWDEAIALLTRLIDERRFTKVSFLNAHNANLACTDPVFAEALENFLILPDGAGVDMAAKLLYGAPFPSNLNGTDFIPAFLQASSHPLTVALLGTTRANAEAACAKLSTLAVQHKFVVIHDGFFSAAEEPAILERIARLRPDVLLVAMGVPRQELWIERHIDSRHCTLPVAVGALLDFMSGSVPRAPLWLRRLRLEWLFRLWIEPGRLWRRYIVGNPLFLWRVVRQKLSLGPRPLEGAPVNSRFVPDAATAIEPLPRVPLAAIVTASYAPDFERCRLLCETIDRHVTGMAHHYILTEHRDVALFRQLEGPRRSVVDERDLLPRWLRVIDDPLSGFRRRVWLSLKTQPLRGWHVQQLRRIAIAGHAKEDVLVFCDSDVAFLKPFDANAFWRDGKVRLFRRDGVLADEGHDEHRIWSRNAGAALGIDAATRSSHDYISTLIAWRRETVNAMCERIEKVHGRDWVGVVGSARKFSECMIYGRYVDDVLEGAGHFHGTEEFCRVHWNGKPLSDDEFRSFVDTMAPEQVAIGMQSFIGTDIGRIRRLIGLG